MMLNAIQRFHAWLWLQSQTANTQNWVKSRGRIYAKQIHLASAILGSNRAAKPIQFRKGWWTTHWHPKVALKPGNQVSFVCCLRRPVSAQLACNPVIVHDSYIIRANLRSRMPPK
jgi:hypothetical protein